MPLGIEPSLLDFSNRVPSANHTSLIIGTVNSAKNKSKNPMQIYMTVVNLSLVSTSGITDLGRVGDPLYNN